MSTALTCDNTAYQQGMSEAHPFSPPFSDLIELVQVLTMTSVQKQ